MKITLYTINDCKFSTEEKDYLKSHSVAFEEKNLETSREYLTEMLAVSNNFAGTPVTKIEFDDGRVVVLKGFTKEEFDETLKLSDAAKMPADMPAPAAQQPPAVAPVQAGMPEATAPVAAPISPMTAAPVNPWEQPAPSTAAPVAPAPQSWAQPAAPVANDDDPLNAILSDLQAKVNEAVATQPTAAPMAAAPAPQSWAPAPVNQPMTMPQTPPMADWSAPVAPAPAAPVQNDWSMPPVQTQQPMAQAPAPQSWAPPAPAADWSTPPAAPTNYGAPQAPAPMGIPPMPGTNQDGTPTA